MELSAQLSTKKCYTCSLPGYTTMISVLHLGGKYKCHIKYMSTVFVLIWQSVMGSYSKINIGDIPVISVRSTDLHNEGCPGSSPGRSTGFAAFHVQSFSIFWQSDPHVIGKHMASHVTANCVHHEMPQSTNIKVSLIPLLIRLLL